MTDCPLCRPDLGPVIGESEHWRLVLNRNQNLLGKCFLVVRRHVESATDLTEPEWLDLRRQLRRAVASLSAAFTPDHFNHAFLQNQDRHVHLHVIPRYQRPRYIASEEFLDIDYPDHYSVPAPSRRLPPEIQDLIVRELRRRWEQAT